MQPIYNNPNDPLNKLIPTKGFCAENGGFYMPEYFKDFLPSNGEYALDKMAIECNACKNEINTETSCYSGCVKNFPRECCATRGQKLGYKRINYKGDKTKCCISGNEMEGIFTCSPQYRDASSLECSDILKNFCSNENLFTNSRCIKWCRTWPEDCIIKKVQYCSNNMNNFRCREFCLQNPGKCDTIVSQYCINNPTDSLCNCINSPISKYKYNPLCLDKNCINSGYVTNSMLTSRGTGCQIVDCSVILDINAGGNVNFDNVDIVQDCQAKKAITETMNTTTNSLLETQTIEKSAQAMNAINKDNNIYIIIGSVFGGLIFILFIGIIIYLKKKY
jgi:hypothetical protein